MIVIGANDTNIAMVRLQVCNIVGIGANDNSIVIVSMHAFTLRQ